jgi:NodT family efflux transporter outer membrane factor (OMF) lipoprotein
MVGPDYKQPALPMPGGWVNTGLVTTTNPASQPSVTSTQPAQLTGWWTSFNDPKLDSLIARAVASNLDLRQASARIRQARAVVGGATAGLFPQINTVGSYRRTGTGPGSGSSASIGGTTTRPTVSRSGSSTERDLWQAGFDASWELDVFGGVRRNIEATNAQLDAALEDRRDVLVTLLSEVAVDYLMLRASQQQIVISQQNLTAQQRTAELTRQLFVGGLRAGLDVANAEALVATTAAQIPSLESNVQQTIYALSVLLGQQPPALVEELNAVAPVPATPPMVPVGLPSDLLRRRPDVRRAERQLASATARIGVATADLFPRFSLTGTLNVSGDKFSALGHWDNRNWSFGPSFTWPILDFGRIRSNIEIQNAAQEEALYFYEQTVLVALQDVESALVAYGKEQQHREGLAQAVTANRRAVDLSTQLYRQGLTDFLNVLDAQRALLLSENALIQSDSIVAQDLVAIYKSLGGGWEAPPTPLPPTTNTGPAPQASAEPPAPATTRQ